MSVKCAECGARKSSVPIARRLGWCRHTFTQHRGVTWSCPDCQDEQTRRALARDPNKRFNFYLGSGQ
jgi:predicted RNA-binding Zn-ribbon protein involved in translation (DUF1610 family)